MIELVELLAGAELALVALVVLLAGPGRAVARRRRREHKALVERYRDAAVEFVATDGASPPPLLCDLARGGERAAVGELLTAYAGSVRGEARRRMGAFLEGQGYVGASVAELRSARREWRRGRAARTLGDFGSPRATRPLAEAMLGDRSAAVRLASARALGAIGAGEAATPLLEAAARGLVATGVAAQALLDIGRPALPQLVASCAACEDQVRAIACRILGLIGAGDEAAVSALEGCAAAERSATVRVAACEALGRIGGDGSGDVLAAAAADADAAVRTAACRALGELRAAGFERLLAGLLADEEPGVVRAAAHAAAATGAEAESPFLAEALAERRWMAA